MKTPKEFTVSVQYKTMLVHFSAVAATEAEAIEQVKQKCIANSVGRFDVADFQWFSRSTFSDRAWWSLLYNRNSQQKSHLVQGLCRAGIITDWQIWDVLSSFHSPFPSSEAAQVYRSMGLEPFAGYPLTKAV